MLKTEIIRFYREQQYLSNTTEFSKGTPSDTIIFKKLPGLGATHGEILLYKWRNSLMLEPNTPVMITKQKSRLPNGKLEYPNLFIVYKKVNRAQVRRYLTNDTFPKKIMCTPEAYISKVKPVIEELNQFDLYNDFFMLLDECDKITKDVDFRESITLPINDFFKFANKAMISATALIPSDPRFAEHNFKVLKVEPQFDFKKNINLISTNSTLGVLKNIIRNYKEERLFIFLNGTDLILSIIKLLDIEHESKVFCADKSAKKLLKMQFNNVATELGEYAKFNFLTSRFFSAVDIKLINEKPNVIMITDVYRAQFSMLDPYTDCVQIMGRLRNGLTRAVHISNFNDTIEWKEKDEALDFLNKAHKTYLLLHSIQDKLAEEEHSLETFQQALDRMDISAFVDDKKKLNNYMVDNFLLEQKVKSYYVNASKLSRAYAETDYFNLKLKPLWHQVSDAQMISMEQKKNNKLLYKTVADILKNNADAKIENKLVFYFGEQEHDLRADYPQIVEAFDKLGYDKMTELEFDKVKINKAVKAYNFNALIYSSQLKKNIKELINIGDKPTVNEVSVILNTAYRKNRVAIPVKPQHILRYCQAERTTNSKNVKVYHIKGFKT